MGKKYTEENVLMESELILEDRSIREVSKIKLYL
jgi:hypothetical protein